MCFFRYTSSRIWFRNVGIPDLYSNLFLQLAIHFHKRIKIKGFRESTDIFKSDLLFDIQISKVLSNKAEPQEKFNSKAKIQPNFLFFLFFVDFLQKSDNSFYDWIEIGYHIFFIDLRTFYLHTVAYNCTCRPTTCLLTSDSSPIRES